MVLQGTNTHAIMEKGPELKAQKDTINLFDHYLFVISAKSNQSLLNLIDTYRHYLATTTDKIEDICYTLAVGRSHFACRLALLVHSKDELLTKLQTLELPIREVKLSEEVVHCEDIEQLHSGYLDGKAIDWKSYYGPHTKILSKVSLPTYQFDRHHYWIETTQSQEQEQLANDCYYELLWQEETSLPELHGLSGTLWVIANEVESDFVIANSLISIKPQSTSSILKLDTLPQDLLGIVYLAPNHPEQEAMHYQSEYAQDFLALTQTLSQKKTSDQHFELGLTLITQNAQSIAEEDTLIGLNSTSLGGMIKALQWEAPFFNPRWIDTDDWNAALSKGLLAAKTALLVLRQGRWYSPTIQQAILNTLPSTLDTQGVHWIIGGTGGLGLALAQYLAGRGVTKLLLSSRHGETCDLPQELLNLRAQGISIEVLALDIMDEKATKTLIKKQARHLTAIYHLAGIEHSGSWMETTPAEMNEVFFPKIGGAALLDKLTQSIKLKYFVLFSSTSSFFGNYHQLAYVAANSYLDALALRRRQQGRPCLCINWGPWAEVGMASKMKLKLDRNQLLPLNLGFTAMERLMSLDISGLAVTQPDAVLSRLEFMSEPRPKWLGCILRQAADIKSFAKRSRLASDLLGLTPELRQARLITLVGQVIQEVLGLTQIPALDKGFFNLGLDSLMSVAVGNRLYERLGVTLKPTAAFDYPTITQLAEYLDATLTEQKRVINYTRNELAADELIAIIGMACRFPGGANTLEQFWTNLYEGVDAIGAVPKARFDIADYYDADTRNTQKAHTKEFGFIDDIDVFDAGFFGISPREALAMDPQQRLLLQTSWHALEDAGIDPRSLKGTRLGIFVGIQGSEYANFVLAQSEENLGVYQATGNALSVAAGRIAYTLGTQGPTLSIDTACSSSLVAMHEAVRSLRDGDCDLALVAGVNSIIDPDFLVALSNAEMLSIDGRCKTFDTHANGYGRAEGCGVVVLQASEAAKTHGARIWATIRATQVNQDGASSGLTVPNGVAQSMLLQDSLFEAGLDPEDIDYIECHGTGTSLGDPIEIGAITEVYAGRELTHPLIVGTVKTNIGHLESAAGIAGVIKTVLSMHHHYIPKHLHFNSLNPHINLEAIPARIPVQGMEWQSNGQKPRRAGVSSFGFSGTNAHVILEEVPADYVPRIKPLAPTEFKQEHYWLETATPYKHPDGYNQTRHPFLQTAIPLMPPQDNTYYFESVINAHYPEFIPDHKIYDYPVIAGAVYLSTALQLAREYLNWSFCQMRQVEFIEVLVLPKNNALMRIYVHVAPQKEEDTYEVSFYSMSGDQDQPTLHVRLLLMQAEALPQRESLNALQAQFLPHIHYDAKTHREKARS